MTAKPSSANSGLSSLPSVDDLLRSDTALRLINEVGRVRLAKLSRQVIGDLRRSIQNGSERSITPRADLLAEAEAHLSAAWQLSRSTGIRRVINATGVVIHTNLGRAPLSDEATRALVEASGYCTVEYDIATGARGKRGARAEAMTCEIAGAEDALIVNNCAAAAYLVLTAFASGGEVIISRGELVEIGGEFRIPDVLARSGATLREVGTTNRTALRDYETAINERTSMILKVHPSNYRIVGFTKAPSLSELSELAQRKNILLYEDAGSGALSDLGSIGLVDEPVISESVKSGVDIVTFSGDKLLGGPQAGIIAGKRKYIEQLRKDPLYRALRVSKLIYAALEATLDSHLKHKAIDEVPVLASLAADSANLQKRCRKLVDDIGNSHLTAEITDGASAVGGGAAPTFQPLGPLVVLKHQDMSAEELARRLRMSTVPVITRIIDDKVTIDLRTVAEDEEQELISALRMV